MTRLHFVFAVLLSAGLFAAPAFGEQLPIEHFSDHPEFSGIKISPTGKYLAARVPVDDQTRLAIINRESTKVEEVFALRRDRRVTGGQQHVAEFEWVGPERLIFNSVTKLGSLDRPQPLGTLWAIDVDGDNFIEIDGGGEFLSILDTLPDDDKHVLLQVFDQSNYAEVVKANIHNGSTRKIARSPVRNGQMGADQDGQVRVAVGNNTEAETIVMYRENNDAQWQELDRFFIRQGGFRPLGFAADGNSFYLASDEDQPTAGIYQYFFKTGEKKLLFRDDTADAQNLIWTHDETAPIGVSYQPDVMRLHFFDNEHPESKIYQGLQSAFPGQSVFITSHTKDGSEGVISVSSDRNPGEYMLVDMKSFSVKPIVEERPWIDPKTQAERKPIELKARDGLVLRGYLTTPPDRKAENLPMIVLPHGGPHGPYDSWFWDPEAQLLANRGYAVLQVNFRGSGNYGGPFQMAGYKKWGMEMQDDLTDATRWAVEEGIADENRICIYGGSYGGYASLQGVVKEPDLYQCAVGYVGVYSLPMMFDEGDIPEREEGKAYLKRILGLDEEDLKQRSPAYNVGKIKADLMLIHGAEDQRVPIAQYHFLTDQLDQAGIDYISLIEDREGHGFYDEENRKEMYEKLLAFFDRHIGAGASGASSTSAQ